MTAREPQPIAPGLYDPAEFVARAPHAVTPLTADAPGDAPPPPLRPTPWRRRFGWMCVALIAFVSGLQAVRFVADAAALAPGLGWVAAGLLLATLSAGLLWIRHEVAEYRRIAAVEALQDESAALLSEDRAGAADAWFAAMARGRLRFDVLAAIRATEDGWIRRDGAQRAALRGVLAGDGGVRRTLVPSDVPPAAPRAEDWPPGGFVHADFAPPDLSGHRARPFPSVNLDKALDHLVGDRLR